MEQPSYGKKGLEVSFRRPGIARAFFQRLKNAAKFEPAYFTRFIWKGKPTQEDAGKIVGMELQMRWYSTHAEYEANDNECPVCTIIVESVRQTKDNGTFICDYNCVLAEYVAPTEAYGRWLRLQRNQGEAPLIDQATRTATSVITTPVVLRFEFRRSTKQERQAARRLFNIEYMPHRLAVANLRMLEPTESSLSDLQIDRIYEFMAAVSEWVHEARENIEARERRQRRLTAEAYEIDAKLRLLKANKVTSDQQLASCRHSFEDVNSRLAKLRKAEVTELSELKASLVKARQALTRANNEVGRLKGLAKQAMRLAMEAVSSFGAGSDQALSLGVSWSKAKEKADMHAPAEVIRAEREIELAQRRLDERNSRINRPLLSAEAELVTTEARLRTAEANAQRAATELCAAEKVKKKIMHDLSDLGG